MIAAPQPIGGVATSITLFIGGAAAGPDDRAVRIASFADYERSFGGLDARAPLGYSVRQFFDNGGTDAYVVRLTRAPGRSNGTNQSALTPGSADFHAALLSNAIWGADGIVDAIDLFNLVCVPGESDPPTLAALQIHCANRRAFLLIDADAAANVASLREGPPAALVSDAAANAAMFFPRLRAADPTQPGGPADLPPSGFIAGLFARNDRARGVWTAAAGVDAALAGANGTAIALRDTEIEELNAAAINCIRTLPGGAIVLWGARTLAGRTGSNSDWTYIPVRRFALFLEESIQRGTRWATFEPNGPALWAALRSSVEAFMLDLFRGGALQGATPAQAFFVRCDATTMTQAEIDAGLVNVIIGMAVVRPAEFIIIRIQQRASKPPP
ncbi:MAG: phage tail sheath C-terminal domain-containing protein [Beijerinckiaceae bacterium]|jgi:Bacteriophage tail sheath protein